MRILFGTSEVFPLAKTGGLADVSHALPAALQARGLEVRVLMPAYPQALEQAVQPRECLRLGDPFGWGEARLLDALPPDSGVPIWLIDCPALYNRSGGLYQDETGADWSDNHLRYGLLCHVAAAIANEVGSGWLPDVIHANDWHMGLVPLLLRPDTRRRTATILAVHNLGYQGLFDASAFDDLGLPQTARGPLEYYGRLSFLKAGLETADHVATVSPTYASEILTPDYGCGLDGVLRARPAPPVGILNGIDMAVWNPANDPLIPTAYSHDSLQGKLKCKRQLRAELGLADAGETPILAYASRLAHQKMPDVVLEALPRLLAHGVQFALVAEGEPHYAQAFAQLAEQYPGQVSVTLDYDERAAHRLLAGADMLLHPSRYEPCGLMPLYAMRYGTIPIVRRCGGLADSVIDVDAGPQDPEAATGFVFTSPTAEALVSCVERALATYARPLMWRRLRARGMNRDFGWTQAAQAYEALYRAAAKAPDADSHLADAAPIFIPRSSRPAQTQRAAL